MADFFKNLKANELISAIICMALGIVLIIWPGTSVKVACMIPVSYTHLTLPTIYSV